MPKHPNFLLYIESLLSHYCSNGNKIYWHTYHPARATSSSLKNTRWVKTDVIGHTSGKAKLKKNHDSSFNNRTNLLQVTLTQSVSGHIYILLRVGRLWIVCHHIKNHAWPWCNIGETKVTFPIATAQRPVRGYSVQDPNAIVVSVSFKLNTFKSWKLEPDNLYYQLKLLPSLRCRFLHPDLWCKWHYAG